MIRKNNATYENDHVWNVNDKNHIYKYIYKHVTVYMYI
jgi:hypothetical protein